MTTIVTATDLLTDFETATRSFLEVLHAFNQSAFNVVPFEGSWTAAQVTEHVHKSDSLMVKTLFGPVLETNRPPDEGVEGLKATFLNFSTKLKSPDFIIPSEAKHEKESLLVAFKLTRDKIGEAIKTLGLTATCPFPVFGDPTRLELVSFIIYHTIRHTRQVRHIAEVLGQPIDQQQ